MHTVSQDCQGSRKLRPLLCRPIRQTQSWGAPTFRRRRRHPKTLTSGAFERSVWSSAKLCAHTFIYVVYKYMQSYCLDFLMNFLATMVAITIKLSNQAGGNSCI